MIFIKMVLHLSLLHALFLVLLVGRIEAAEVPLSVGGITLGTSVDSYPDIIRNNFLKEVVITDQKGFRKGIISFGACLHKDIILKIDMKYADKSKNFYKKLLKEFRHKFGDPDSWEGDSFGILYLWKWRFIDPEGNMVTMALQYNGKDSQETIGNMVKLSYPIKIEEERLCFVEMCDKQAEKRNADQKKEHLEPDWSLLIPD